MQIITLHSRVASDGSLQLQLPDELKGYEVTVTIKPSIQPLNSSLGIDLGWPEGFLLKQQAHWRMMSLLFVTLKEATNLVRD